MKTQHQDEQSLAISKLAKLSSLSVGNIFIALVLWPATVISVIYIAITLKQMKRSGALLSKETRDAVPGIIAMNSIALLIVGGILTVIIGLVRQGQRINRTNLTVESLKKIYQQEKEFRQANSRFGTLSEIRRFGVGKSMSTESVNGYEIRLSNLNSNSYCVEALRTEDSSGMGDFILCENGELRIRHSFSESALQRGEGISVQWLHSDPACPSPTP